MLTNPYPVLMMTFHDRKRGWCRWCIDVVELDWVGWTLVVLGNSRWDIRSFAGPSKEVHDLHVPFVKVGIARTREMEGWRKVGLGGCHLLVLFTLGGVENCGVIVHTMLQATPVAHRFWQTDEIVLRSKSPRKLFSGGHGNRVALAYLHMCSSSGSG